MRVLVVPVDNFGCGLYRMTQPAEAVVELCEDVVVDFFDPPHEGLTPQTVESYDLVILQRIRSAYVNDVPVDLNYDLLEAAARRNIPTIYDHDDNDYALPRHHGLYDVFQKEKISDKMTASFKAATAVTTTTDYIARVFGERCGDPKKVFVFPNCIRPTDPQWTYECPPSRRTRIGWAGGSSHLHDLRLLQGMSADLHRVYGDRLQFQLGGYDTRGRFSWRDNHGNAQSRDIEPHETVWKDMEAALFFDLPLSARRTLKTLDIKRYGFFWSQFDIGVVPLEDTEFTRAKSALKMLEYGAYGIPVVASAVWPYVDFIGNTGAATLVPAGRGNSIHKWVEAVSVLIDDPVYRYEQGQRLKRLVNRRYNVRTWAPVRLRLWRELVNKQTPTPIVPERDIVQWHLGAG